MNWMIMKSIDIELYILFGLCLSAPQVLLLTLFLSHSHSHVCHAHAIGSVYNEKHACYLLFVVYGREILFLIHTFFLSHFNSSRHTLKIGRARAIIKNNKSTIAPYVWLLLTDHKKIYKNTVIELSYCLVKHECIKSSFHSIAYLSRSFKAFPFSIKRNRALFPSLFAISRQF